MREIAMRHGMVEASELTELKRQARIDKAWIVAAQQAFAELNAANPIFVEDAARLFCEALRADRRIGDFRVVASHQESLHSHDAISLLTEGDTFAATSLDPRLFQTLIHAR